MSNRYEMMKGKAVWSITGLLVLIAVAFIILSSGKNHDADVVEETVETGVESIAMQPIVTEDYTYRFEGIDWQFPVEERGTRVNFMFENFSRIEGAYVTFGNPYKLGFYEGECQEVESLPFDAEKHSGIPLSFAECVSPDVTQQFALFQQGEEIAAKLRRTYSQDNKESDFVTIYTIDLTEVVAG
jgi:hypothetical protein